MISTDRTIFEENSEARQRMVEYGNLVEELHIIIFSKKDFSQQNFGNVFIYSTDSLSKWFYMRDAVRIGRKILGSNGKWLITSQDPFETGWVGYKLSKIFNIPLQLQIHTDFLSPYFVQHSMLHRMRVRIAKFLIPRANCIRVVSERIKKSLKTKNYKLKTEISVLPIFVDVKKIQETEVRIDLHKKYPQFDFIILMASRLTKEKNIEMIIEVMKNILKRYPKTGLIITGFGQEEKNIKHKIKKFKLNNNIVLENWTDDLISYYKTCDAFLLNSFYEGYGRTAVEAITSGCVVIMTDVGIANDIAKDKYNSLIVPVNDRIAMEKAIEKAINDKALRASISLSSENLSYKMPSKDEYLKKIKESWETCDC